MPNLPKNKNTETWGYTLINSTIDNLIRHLEGQETLKSYPELRERRERAQ
ncbi:hypothetical protein [Trichormus azollae]|jgi:hypothetical protein